MRASEADLAYFWSDGNYATKRYKDDCLRKQIAQIEMHRERLRQEEADRRKYQSIRDRNEGHPGIDCCGSCYGEYEEGYGVILDGYCCCRDQRGKERVYPLDFPQYQPLYPPVNGKVPEIFKKWGPKTQERYLRRFKDELDA